MLSWKAFLLGIVLLGLVFVILSALTGGLFGVGGLIHSGLDYIWGGKMIGKIGEAEPLIYDSETFYQVVFSGLGLNLLFPWLRLLPLWLAFGGKVGAKNRVRSSFLSGQSAPSYLRLDSPGSSTSPPSPWAF